MATNKTQVTIRTRQTVLISSLRIRCQRCGADVSIVTPESAAGVLQTSPLEIEGLVESGVIHTVAKPSGENLICGNSLSATSDSDSETLIEGERK